MNQDLRTAIRRIVGQGATVQVCEVISVDVDKRTAKVKDVGEFTVTLMPEVSDGLLLKPSVGSTVCVLQGIIIAYSEIDEIWLRGQQFGSLIKITELVDKLNNLEDKVNSIVTTYNSHTHASSSSPAVPLVTGSPLTPTTINDLENPNVKHG